MDLLAFALEHHDMYNVDSPIKRGEGFFYTLQVNITLYNYCITTVHVTTVHVMSKCIDAILECITVEVKIHNATNCLLSCMYRPPVSCIDFL